MYNVLNYLESSASQYPDKIAFADKDKSITYPVSYTHLDVYKRQAC